MKRKRLVSLFLVFALAFSLLAGCGSTNSSEPNTQQPSQGTTTGTDTEQGNNVDENQAAAEQLLLDLEGTYQELWPVVLADEYDQLWLDTSAGLVGEDNAEGAVEMMASMVTGTLTGEEAVAAYQDGNMAYCCEFMQNVEHFTFNGTTISGADANGKELFSHSYHYVGMEDVRGLYVYESDDANSGEFTYFCMAPDTMETTQHIEFRYGSDLDALGQYDAGPYAYWLAAGISTEYTQEDTEKCIVLFCTENLSE